MADTTLHPTYRIADLHESERPRERLATLGPQALSNAELIAILLRRRDWRKCRPSRSALVAEI